jgi:hypothetical protein
MRSAARGAGGLAASTRWPRQQAMSLMPVVIAIVLVMFRLRSRSATTIETDVMTNADVSAVGSPDSIERPGGKAVAEPAQASDTFAELVEASGTPSSSPAGGS